MTKTQPEEGGPAAAAVGQLRRGGLASVAVAVAVVVGWLLLLEALVNPPGSNAGGALRASREAIITTVTILAAFALLRGLANVLGFHWRRIQAQGAGAFYSWVVVLSAVAVIAVGLFGDIFHGPLSFIFEYVYIPLNETIFSLLAFLVVYAAFRAFRLRTAEASVLMIVALLTLIGETPLGDLVKNPYIPSGPSLKTFIAWVALVPNLAVERGITLGAALGAITTCIRVLLGIDRHYLN